MTVSIRPSITYPVPPPPAYSTIPMDGRQLAQLNVSASPFRSTQHQQCNSLQPRNNANGQLFNFTDSYAGVVAPTPAAHKQVGKLPVKIKAKSHSSIVSYRVGGGSMGGNPTDGCCLIKTLISNLLNFATRSRRKAENLQQHHQQLKGGGATMGMAMVSPAAPQQLTPATELPTTGQPSISSNSGENRTNNTGIQPASPTKKGIDAGSNRAQSLAPYPPTIDTTLAVGAAGRKLTAQPSIEARCVADSLDDEMLDRLCETPEQLDRNEWLATQTLSLFHHVNALCGMVSDVCTPVSCSAMSFPGTSKASWVDERGKRHHYSAARYIDSVMSYCDASCLNPALFPTKHGTAFGTDFEPTCQRIVRLLWHCMGHLFVKHWDYVSALNLKSQFAVVLAHMSRVSKFYKFLENKEGAQLSNTLLVIRPSSIHMTTKATSRATSKQAPTATSDSSSSRSTSSSPAPRDKGAEWYFEETGGGDPSPHSSAASTQPNNPKILCDKRGEDRCGEDKQTAAGLGKVAMRWSMASSRTKCGGMLGALALPMRSGSWGGGHAPPPPLLPGFNKARYAQTC